MYYHRLVEKADSWRLDFLRVRVEGLSVGKVLSVVREALGEVEDGRRVFGCCRELPGSLTYRLLDGCLSVQASGLVASSDWLRELFCGLPGQDWSVRAVDWCCDFLGVGCGVIDRLRSECTSFVGDRDGGLTMYFGKVGRSCRRFSRVYLWRVEKGGDVFLRLEHCVRPVGGREVDSVSQAFVRGWFVGGGVGRFGRVAESVLAGCGVVVPERSVVGVMGLSKDVVRGRSVLYRLKRVRRELQCIDGVSGVGTLLWYVEQMREVYSDVRECSV
jgi:hypothetical protein